MLHSTDAVALRQRIACQFTYLVRLAGLEQQASVEMSLRVNAGRRRIISLTLSYDGALNLVEHGNQQTGLASSG
jgi:hypothetical protein